MLCRTLSAGVVDGIVPGEDDLGNGDEGVAFLKQTLNDTGQSLRGVFCGIVEQDDGAGTDLACDPLGDVRCGQVLPVQTVPAGSGWKALGDKGLRMWRRVVFSVG